MDVGNKATRRFGHPGAGRRQALPHSKGRQSDPEAMAEVERTLAGRPRDRDQLIELLHALQDSYGCLAFMRISISLTMASKRRRRSPCASATA
jgi:NADH:ubiquinone oxidoreductase subunit E